jgi:hypothetical protein
MEKKLLEVGDVLYAKSYNKIYGTYTIERVTATQAISRNSRFKRECSFGRAYLIGADAWSITRYYLETEELKIELERQRITDMVIMKGLGGLTIDELRLIKKMISDKNDKRSVASKVQ